MHELALINKLHILKFQNWEFYAKKTQAFALLHFDWGLQSEHVKVKILPADNLQVAV